MASTFRGVRKGLSFFVIAIVALSLAACGQDKEDDLFVGSVDRPETNQILGQVAAGDVDGTYVAEVLPSGTTTAPDVLGSSQYIVGASIVLMVTVDEAASELLVGVRNTDGGYYRIPLNTALKRSSDEWSYGGASGEHGKQGMRKRTLDDPLASTARATVDYVVTLTPAQDPAYSTFTVDVVASDGAQYSAARGHAVRPNTVAGRSNNLQVSLNWVHAVDYDLHVETPTGTDIYWANRSADGGALDLDSNAGCNIDNVNNENITWLNQIPSAGTYTVRVNLWSSCVDPGPFPYVVTVMLGGQPTTFWGEMTTGDAFAGGAHDGTIIQEFNVSPAQIARMQDR